MRVGIQDWRTVSAHAFDHRIAECRRSQYPHHLSFKLIAEPDIKGLEVFLRTSVIAFEMIQPVGQLRDEPVARRRPASGKDRLKRIDQWEVGRFAESRHIS